MEESKRKEDRGHQLVLGAALGGAADLSAVPAQRDEYRRRQLETYGRLVERDAGDAQALLGLAGISEDRNERITLLKRAVAADPGNTIMLRALASELSNGTPGESREAFKYLRQAYDRAEAPHRWHLASMLHAELTAAGAKDEAQAFAQTVLDAMGVAAAANTIKRVIAAPKELGSSAAFDALDKVCDANALRLGAKEQCIESLAGLASTIGQEKRSLRRKGVDSIARASLNLLNQTRSIDPSAAATHRSIRTSIERVRSAGNESALLLNAQAHVMLIEAPTTTLRERAKLLERGIALEPKSGEARMWLAREYMLQGRFREAVEQLEAAIPLLPPYKRGAAQGNLLVALREAGEIKRADELQERMRKDGDK